ncbi:tRNA lysidine(34) synthetase TilS [Phyllobacterium endophyticum]|uniref:tRNA(Ile)-lysidine synthase n=1 Tax=Phyllobacterium endophyticum TaxID=1149773 RepID=A0A2P7ALP9_9HYPH|nr:tRNA lysidine(34) synthetase TilS [Phyllobacterium endophyticum]MBB3236331.1 tRNA(Ile)-lysidine synthase [Phyllobacterium endophyticum]PSH55125.1 tRNA lysidine(34) synthetase TilS [Phyllobacterium endophyticum]TYR39873.1 tRNA lysidine(34) synthetase TilS [Phyllobacterium endophyticum]
MNVPPTNADAELDPVGIFRTIDFQGLSSVIVAVSGGSDSLALLHLLLAYRELKGLVPKIVAVTVDHGLRRESAEEARFVSKLCEDAGIAHQTLNWRGTKPDTGISAKARDARYDLLRKAARDAGTDVILTGHTLDDQIETFVMRSARTGAMGTGRGLAVMAPATLLEREIWLIRPLLDIPREKLRNYLRQHNISWRDDPTNDDLKYERVRVRKALQSADRDGLEREIAQRAGARRELNSRVAQVLSSCATIHEDRVEVSRAELFKHEPDVQDLTIGVLLAAMGGQSFLPSADNCAKASQHLGSKASSGRRTLHRCVLQLRIDKAIIYRENRSLPEIVVETGETAVWDGRYRITNCSGRAIKVVAAGAAEPVPSMVSSPVVLLDDESAVPMDQARLPGGISVARHLALFDHVLSGYDEILAKSVAKLFRLQDYKPCPVNQVNKN